MRNKHYAFTKPRIVSARISDDEMEHIETIMTMTSLSASEVMRKAFLLQMKRFNETGKLSNSGR